MLTLLVSALALAAQPAASAPYANPLDPAAWAIAFSRGMPPRPAPAAAGWSIDFPYPSPREGHVNYVSFRPGPLAGKRAIVVDYAIEAAPGTRFLSRETPELPATVSVILQRRGDRLTAAYANYRWYAPARTVQRLAPGRYRMTVPIDESWTSVLGEPAADHRQAFHEALADTGRLGLVFGTSQARGHGVFATGPARLTLTAFRIL